MSAARVLDDLARTLAQPMPRRRALRVLGMSVAAVAVPGMRPSLARGARAAAPHCTQGAKCCGHDERVCGRPGKEYCCRAPSWQIHCGARGTKCVNTCTGEDNFPCTALIPHPESGINGVCCDRFLHNLCLPVGRPATCCYGSPITCKPMGKAQCRRLGPDPSQERARNDRRPPAFWAPSEEWKPSCCFAAYTCGGVCCEPPNFCNNNRRCQCPSGGVSCDGRTCCPAPKNCTTCVERTSLARFDGNDVYARDVQAGKQCCPAGQRCCRTKCCRGNSCCGEKCCKPRQLCARAVGGGTDVCCPTRRVRPHVPSSRLACCPKGTVNMEHGCCSGSEPDCCPFRDSSGALIDCEASGQICVQGQCKNP